MFPLSATSITRRSAMFAIGAGLGTMTLRPPCLAADNTLAAEFLVISDTHLGRNDNDEAVLQWEATAKELATAPGEVVLHLGDVVDGGREAQYAIYKATAKTIGKPIHAIPGNHDPANLFARHIREEIDTVVDHAGLRVVLMGNARSDSHDGFLEPAQLTWLDKQCREAANHKRYVIICMHVPAHTNGHPDRGWYVKPEHGQKELYAILAAHRDRIVALFHGHFHNGIRGWDDTTGIPEIVFPSALYNQDRKLVDQRAPGYNLKEFRPGYTRVRIKDGVMTLLYKPLGEEASAKKECKL
jgi:3',5'-cyclic AMP phosphodiesterase CpdA